MDLTLTAAQRAFQARVRDFADAEVRPVAAALDREGRCPDELIARLGDIGMLGALVPQELGGTGADVVSYILGLEEISSAWASLGAIVSIHNSLVCDPILRFGSEAQQRAYLPRLTQDRQLGCYAFAEPLAGSDANAVETTAHRTDETFVLDGRKVYVANGTRATLALVYALTDQARGRRGMSVFLVDTTLPGLSVGAVDDKMGLHALDTTEFRFTRCPVPAANLLGKLHGGFDIAVAAAEGARVDLAALATGIGQACLDASVAEAKTRRQFSRPIAEFQAVQWMIADMSTELEAARLLTYRAATTRERGESLTQHGSMAKLFASQATNRAASAAVQIFGGRGYLKDFSVERLYRDARATTLYEETSELLRLVVHRALLKGNRD